MQPQLEVANIFFFKPCIYHTFPFYLFEFLLEESYICVSCEFRAKRLEKLLDTPARIYYKYEGVSPAGSHKPNSAVPQA